MNTFQKETTIFEADAMINYYKKIRNDQTSKDKFNVFSLGTQWNIKKDVDELIKAISSYAEFRDEKRKELNEKYFNEEKSEETTVTQMVDGEEKEVTARQIKSEYIDEFKSENTDLLNELLKLASEKVTVNLVSIDIDNEVSLLESKNIDNDINMDDLDFLSFFKE